MSGRNTMPENITVIIPSYCPDDRLLATVHGLIAAGADDIAVINDGSGKEYEPVFDEVRSMSCCTVIEHASNRGKGAAIKSGMVFCLTERPASRGIVTVDGDGHHRVRDAVSCAHRMISSGRVIIGQRGRNDKTISPRGRYGNRITSFAIAVVCGFNIPDPLSGLRGIPAKFLSVFLKTKGDRYDFETNMLLDLKRKSIPFRLFSITGEFFPDGKKSHFRLFRDSAGIFAEILRYFGQQFRYMLSSALCYSFEYIVYRILLGYLPMLGITLTNYICRAMAGSLNFFINKKVVFRTKKKNITTAVRYLAVSVFVMLLSTELIVIINKLFLTEKNTVAKFVKPPVDFAMFFVSYFLQKKWVFAPRKKKTV